MSPFAADSAEGRILLALRAGAMDADACAARFPAINFGKHVSALISAGLAAHDDQTYRLTPAGRAACPFRNPLAAPGELSHTSQTHGASSMKQKITPADVIATIVAAGPRGTTVKNLTVDFGVSDQAVFNARKKVAGEFFIRGRGVMVANRFIETTITPAATTAAAKLEAEVKELERQYDEMIDFEIEPATGEPSMDAMANPAETSGSPVAETEPTPAHGPETFVADLHESAERAGVEPTYLPRKQPIVEDITLIDPDTVEFAVFSSGGLDIYSDDGTVTMTAPVLRKLRAFLGLFMEPA